MNHKNSLTKKTKINKTLHAELMLLVADEFEKVLFFYNWHKSSRKKMNFQQLFILSDKLAQLHYDIYRQQGLELKEMNFSENYWDKVKKMDLNTQALFRYLRKLMMEIDKKIYLFGFLSQPDFTLRVYRLEKQRTQSVAQIFNSKMINFMTNLAMMNKEDLLPTICIKLKLKIHNDYTTLIFTISDQLIVIESSHTLKVEIFVNNYEQTRRDVEKELDTMVNALHTLIPTR